MSASPTAVSQLQQSRDYPFDLAGPLCPLLNDGPLLLSVYEAAGARLAIKQFCKRTAWPGKPALGFAMDVAKFQELLGSLFNTPAARDQLRDQAAADRVLFLDNAIWGWLGEQCPNLVKRLIACCETIDEKSFIRVEPFAKLVAELKPAPAPADVAHLAYAVLAFAMLQPADRFALGETFLAAFPEYAGKFGAAAGRL